MVTNKGDKDEKKNRSSSPSGCIIGDLEKDGDSGMRVGRAYQAEIPHCCIPLDSKKSDICPERALLVWAPNQNIKESELDEYLWLAKDKYGYNAEQALGMLFWHRHDVEKASRDLANFTPFPDEWTTEDKVLFEQAFLFHGKNFHRIRQMLPEKSIAHLVKYYYLWKKTRQRSSLIDKHARKHAAKLEGVDTQQLSGDRSDEDEENLIVKSEDAKLCVNCSVPASFLQETPKGGQCSTCFKHWKKVGFLRPTVGPMKKDKQLIKHKRRPPRGMYINHDDLVAMASPGVSIVSNTHASQNNDPGQKILKHMENEVIALKRQVQANKAHLSFIRSSMNNFSIDCYRPTNQVIRYNAKWTNDELLLAVQGVRQFGRNFRAIADIIGNKTENHVRSFFVSYRKRYNLDAIYKEWEDEFGPELQNNEDKKPVLPQENEEKTTSRSK